MRMVWCGWLLLAAGIAMAAPEGDGIPLDGNKAFQVDATPLNVNPQAFSVACWVRWTRSDGDQMFVCMNFPLFHSMDSPRKDFALYLYKGNLRMLVEHTEKSYQYAKVPAPAANVWTHLAGTYDGETICLYVNGECVASQKAPGQRKTFGPTIYLGAAKDPGRNLVGNLDDVRLYNRVLSETQVQDLAAGKAPSEEKLLGVWNAENIEKKAKSFVPGANTLLNTKDDGFRSIWYYNQASGDKYVYKYSGGLGVYPANHYPFAVYRPEVNKTFFCYGGTDKEGTTLWHEVSYFDHATKTVARPTILLDKKTDDAHDNPVMTVDDAGYLWIFSTSHGTWRPSFIHKSVKPYDIDAFELVPATKIVDGEEVPMTNFSYVQVFNVPGEGMVSLFTTYDKTLLNDPKSKAQRILCFMSSQDGVRWSAWKPLAAIAYGHYQNAAVWQKDGVTKIGTAFNYHPDDPQNGRVGLNWRTNVYYMESLDGGATWQSITGEKLTTPLTEIQSPARVYDYDTLRKNVYIMDMVYDAKGYPVIFYITSNGYRSGPEAGPREWFTAAWNGTSWDIHKMTESDNNYDFGSLYIEPDGTWQAVCTDGIGPQAYNTGGEVSLWSSADRGKTWVKVRQMTENSPLNHCYPRRPIAFHPDFYAIWADGHGRQKSEANLYYSDRDGNVHRLPRILETP
ncbi:MAG: LamG-like jellyroll fold domain-containing protein [Planctomycetia bacterium]|nr:LamG-like jellyroll fold domain-containing protein [Planctomycetia bacterium]